MTDELDLDLLADLVRRTLSPVPPRGTLDYADYVESSYGAFAIQEEAFRESLRGRLDYADYTEDAHAED